MDRHKVIVCRREDGEQRWFLGGGLHTWKAKAEETGNAFLLFEDHMPAGKVTPLHTHPADESFYVLEGEIVVHVDDEEIPLGPGDFATVLRGVAHAFMTTGETRLLCLQTPGDAQAFFTHASEPATEPTIHGPVDFERVAAAAQQYGGVEMLGPPPFAVAHR